MAKLSNFTVNSKARESGDWVTLDDFDGLRIKTRGFTDQYVDARAARLRRKASQYQGDQSKIPNAVMRTVLVDCLIEFCLQDVDALEREDGTPVAFSEFCAMLRDPEYGDLFNAANVAASQVGRASAAALEVALGNSATPAGSTSNGEVSGT